MGNRFGNNQHGFEIVREMPARVEETRAFHAGLGNACCELFQLSERFFQVFVCAENSHKIVHHFLQVENAQDQRYGLERYSKETARLYGVLDRRLAQHEYVADALSIADFAILGWAWRHERHKIDLAEFPNVQRWYETIMARPATIRGFEVPLS